MIDLKSKEQREKPEILKFILIKNGFIIMVYRIAKVLHFRTVGYVYPLRLESSVIEKEFGRDESYNEEEMVANLSHKMVHLKLFAEFIVQPRGGRIIGIFRHPIRDETVFRAIGFVNPKGLEAKYRELLAEQGKPEAIPYWKAFGLGDEWAGSGITREKDLFTLSVPHSESLKFEVQEAFS